MVHIFLFVFFVLQKQLWEGVRDGTIDLVISDHSPCPADLKLLDSGDFLGAWGGIASVQFGEFHNIIMLLRFLL